MSIDTKRHESVIPQASFLLSEMENVKLSLCLFKHYTIKMYDGVEV
jgi:hypothetical protein